ncbi:MAG TPA: APC family permease [Rhizomicrobium sp.]|jgi:amino acid transporter|nr:APC family permease [Rhizomicrobium sp.]
MSGGANDLSAFGYRQELKRSLGMFDLLAYGLVFIVPVAPVAVFGIVFNASRGMVPLVYVVGLVAMVFTALSYMTMSKAFPVAGSVYTYASRSLGPTVGFFSGWAILLDYLLLPALTYVVAGIAMHAAMPATPKVLWVVVMLAAATFINYLGIEATARVNFVLLAFQLAVLALFGVLGGLAVAHYVAGAHVSLEPFYRPGAVTPGLIFGALSLAVLSFLGFDAISTLSEESRDGAAAVGRATMLSLCLSAILFVAQTWLASLFFLGRTGFAPGDAANTAFYDVAALVGGYAFKFLVAVPVIFLSGVAGAVTAQAASARLLFGMARDGELPRALAHVDPRRKVPTRAVFLIAAVTLVLSLLMVDQLELLTSMVSFGALLGFLLLHLSVVAHFIWHRKSRDWLRHLVTPAIGFLIIAYVLWNSEANAKIAGSCWFAAGLVLFVTLKLLKRPTPLPT